MKLLRMPISPMQGDTVSHGGSGWLVNNQSGIVSVPDHVADFMLADGRSGCQPVTDPLVEGGEIITCPCSHHAWRRKQQLPE
jgi:hypothetical protein